MCIRDRYKRAKKLDKKLSIATIALIAVLVAGGTSYIYTAPYAGNSGFSRMPGVRIGGTLAPAPEDFSSLNDIGTNLIMKLDGFPPFVVYLAYVGTPEGVITGTRPDGGCLLYTSPSPRDRTRSRMPSSA